MCGLPNWCGTANLKGEDVTASQRLRSARAAGLGLVLALLLILAGLVAGCGSSRVSYGTAGGTLSVVSAENFWGSIASQLAGSRAQVVSIITNPNTDPHEYEPTAQDALELSGARLVIENGIGYDPWADRLLGAASVPGRLVISVGDVVGLKPGENPHQWYSGNPASARKLVFLKPNGAKLLPADQPDRAMPATTASG
jgi:zinc/manganese transport system substrate-binding protein